jgi:4-hydroxy-tetrahydrodipicolinate reductase
MARREKLNIALLGYGKMGKIIEEIAIERGHAISFIANSSNADFSADALSTSDVAIEFSLPEYAVSNIKKCVAANVPVAIGTTGWYDDLDEITALCKSQNGCILPATNFSIGVNIFFEINKHLASLMDQQTQYEPSITEIHHTQKLDAPSGTAITLAEGIICNMERKSKWNKEIAELKSDLTIKSLRIDEVPGTHDVLYESDIDKITISHEAKNRKGFALGAVLAAEFLHKKKGIYSMRQVLGLK